MRKPCTPCSPTKKRAIVIYHQLGFKPGDIAPKVNLEVSGIRKQLKKLGEDIDVYAKTPRPGRPKRLNSHDLRRARRAIMSGELPDATAVQREMFPDVSARTVQRALCGIGLFGRVRRKKPLLTKQHKFRRQQWVKVYGRWSLKKWTRVWFSDEAK